MSYRLIILFLVGFALGAYHGNHYTLQLGSLCLLAGFIIIANLFPNQSRIK